MSADEETVGNGDIVVGDGVTATFDEETGALEFYSDGGTLWKNWLAQSGLDMDSIVSIKVSSGTVYLPEDSGSIFALGSFSYDTWASESNLKELDLRGFDTSNVVNMKKMFENCNELTALDVSDFDTSNVEDMGYMFKGCSELTELDVSGFDTSNVENMHEMFYDCSKLTGLDVSDFDTSNVENMGYMFKGCSELTELDVSGFDTSNVDSMNFMFDGCSALTSIDVSGFKTAKVSSMACIFRDCIGLTSIDVSGFDTSNNEDVSQMFAGCSNLTSIDVSGFDTSNVWDMEGMFAGCSNLTSIDVSGFDTSNVWTMDEMFLGCSGLTSLDVSGFDTSNVLTMIKMFSGCSSLTSLDVSGFDTSKAATMEEMFLGCSSLTSLDVSGFDTSNVLTMIKMFSGCSNLTSLDISSFDTTHIYNANCMNDMFEGCSALQVLKTPKKNETNVDLPVLMYDSAANEYETLPALSESIVLTREKPDLRIDISDCEITLSPVSYIYDGKAKEPTVTVKRESETLTLGADYTVTYLDNTNAGTATVKVEGIGGFKGEKTVTFTISKPAGFSDVQDPGHAYYKAIYWAAEKGITKGYPDGTFGINKNVSRGECMMFLWRLKGKPAPRAVAKSPFKDVPKNHAFYNAILWGAQKKVTTGYTSGEYKGKFMVNQNCSRGQIVTFLYRAK